MRRDKAGAPLPKTKQMKEKKEPLFVPGSIVRMKHDGPLGIFKAGSYQMLTDAYCNGDVRIDSGNGNAYTIDGNVVEVVEVPGKPVLKKFIQYLILYWLKKNVINQGNREFHGIELAKFVKAKVGRPDMYNPTVFRYMYELGQQNKVGTFCKVRQKSLYFCQWVDLEALKKYYTD